LKLTDFYGLKKVDPKGKNFLFTLKHAVFSTESDKKSDFIIFTILVVPISAKTGQGGSKNENQKFFKKWQIWKNS
jgi:hypothetical protein